MKGVFIYFIANMIKSIFQYAFVVHVQENIRPKKVELSTTLLIRHMFLNVERGILTMSFGDVSLLL